MINYHSALVSALKEILPTHYEHVLTSNTEVPCISYMEISNVEEVVGDTVGYSRVHIQVKVWGYDIEEISMYAKQIDKKLKPQGWTRTGTAELFDRASGLMQKVLNYSGLSFERYEED